MTGIAIILYHAGWSISNECKLDADKTLVDIDGKKYLKDVLTLKLNSIFDVNTKVAINDSVECLFMTDEGKKFAFIGIVKTRGLKLVVIDNLQKSERYNEILNKVKSCQILKT